MKRELQQLRQHYQGPVIVLASASDPSFHSDVINCGANSCLAKPLSHKKFHRALLQLLTWQDDETTDSPHQPVLSAPPAHHKLKVLLVDDHPANLKLARVFLEELNADVVSADNGAQAVKFASRERFDIIFMDIQMPGMDGPQATRLIREQEHETKQRTPIIALTAHAMAGEKEQLLAEGMDDYLSKPIDEAQLANTIEKWVRPDQQLDSPDQLSLPAPKASTPTQVAVIDEAVALKLAGNKPELAAEMMRMMLERLPNEQDSISQLLQQQHWEQLEEVIHKLHGACCYCGVVALKEVCAQCETALKQGDMDTASKSAHQVLDAIQQVLNAPDAYRLAQLDSPSSMTKASA